MSAHSKKVQLCGLLYSITGRIEDCNVASNLLISCSEKNIEIVNNFVMTLYLLDFVQLGNRAKAAQHPFFKYLMKSGTLP